MRVTTAGKTSPRRSSSPAWSSASTRRKATAASRPPGRQPGLAQRHRREGRQGPRPQHALAGVREAGQTRPDEPHARPAGGVGRGAGADPGACQAGGAGQQHVRKPPRQPPLREALQAHAAAEAKAARRKKKPGRKPRNRHKGGRNDRRHSEAEPTPPR